MTVTTGTLAGSLERGKSATPLHAATACSSGGVCIEQPNATGVCGAQPPGYKAPGTKRFWKRPSPTGAVKKGKKIRPGVKKRPGVKLPSGVRPKLR